MKREKGIDGGGGECGRGRQERGQGRGRKKGERDERFDLVGRTGRKSSLVGVL